MVELCFKVFSACLEGPRKLGNLLAGLWTKVLLKYERIALSTGLRSSFPV